MDVPLAKKAVQSLLVFLKGKYRSSWPTASLPLLKLVMHSYYNPF